LRKVKNAYTYRLCITDTADTGMISQMEILMSVGKGGSQLTYPGETFVTLSREESGLEGERQHLAVLIA